MSTVELRDERLGKSFRSDGRRAKMFGLVPQTPAPLPWRPVRENPAFLSGIGRGRAVTESNTINASIANPQRSVER